METTEKKLEAFLDKGGSEMFSWGQELGGELGSFDSDGDKAGDVYHKHHRERKQQISEGDSGEEGLSNG